jgi:hypothetical protein
VAKLVTQFCALSILRAAAFLLAQITQASELHPKNLNFAEILTENVTNQKRAKNVQASVEGTS